MIEFKNIQYGQVVAGRPTEKTCPDCGDSFYFSHECEKKPEENGEKKSNRKLKREKREKQNQRGN